MELRKTSLALLAAMLCFSCSEQNFYDEPTATSPQAVDEPIGEASSDIVSRSDLSRIAAQFPSSESGARTRTSQQYSVSTIYDSTGLPAVYAINYAGNKGFVLVSATKRYNPILAYSDTGNFDTGSEMPGGLQMWKEQVIDEIKMAQTLPEDSIERFRQMWLKYEDPERQIAKVKNNVKRLSQSSDPTIDQWIMDAQLILMDSVSSWTSKGYKVYTPEDESDIELVKSSIYPLFEEEWQRLSVVVEHEIVYKTTVSNFMQTKWGQANGFNASCPKIDGKLTIVGCGPVALGQVMRYFQHPSYFDWNAMPANYATTQTANFLYDVGVKSNADFGVLATGTTLGNIKNALETYGYSAEYKFSSNGSHNFNKAWDCLKRKIPVIMGGNPINDEGHAWVACGGETRMYLYRKDLMTFANRTGLRSIRNNDRYILDEEYLYMNWGWYGSSDGFYLDSKLKLPYSPNDVEKRNDIYYITPKR